MDFGKMFSFDGRITRSTFWGLTAIYVVGILIISLLAATDVTLLAIVGIILAIPLIVLQLATSVKRWHDRDKSGWWILIGLIPLVGGIWAFVETGCLAGTAGPNRFGTESSGSPFGG